MPRKSATWETALLPPQGRHAVDFFARKIRRLRPRSNPRSWVPEASMLTTRPPKPVTLVGLDTQRKETTWKTRRRRQDNIKMNLTNRVGGGGMDSAGSSL